MSGGGHTAVTTRFDLVVVITSLGGMAAVSAVLRRLPAAFPVPIVVVQHRLARSDDEEYARLLGRTSALPVRVAVQGEPAAQPGVAIIPGGSEAELNSDLQYHLTASTAHWPDRSGDRICASACSLGKTLVGVVLTGRLSDGAEGARAIKRGGGRVLVQDPRTARSPGMPNSAIATGCVDHVLPLDHIGMALVALVMAPGGAELLAVPTPPWADLTA